MEALNVMKVVVKRMKKSERREKGWNGTERREE
jgi:hypothetical protein